MKCPACGNRGNRDDGLHFDVMGQVDGTPIRKCLSCGAGLSVGAFNRARVIPPNLWAKMEAEWGEAFPQPPQAPQSVAPLMSQMGVLGTPGWFDATMTPEEKERKETSQRALSEIDFYRSDLPAEIDQMLRAYASAIVGEEGSNEWTPHEVVAIAADLCRWGYGTRLWEENRFPEVAPSRIPEVETIVAQGQRAKNVPDGAEVAEAAASLADGGEQDPEELLAATPGINPEMRADLACECAWSIVDAVMKSIRKLAPPPTLPPELQMQCWRFGFFTRCCEASMPPSN